MVAPLGVSAVAVAAHTDQRRMQQVELTSHAQESVRMAHSTPRPWRTEAFLGRIWAATAVSIHMRTQDSERGTSLVSAGFSGFPWKSDHAYSGF